MTAAHALEQAGPTFRDLAAAEVRAQLGRKGMSGRTLARALGKEPTWVSRRLKGIIPMTTDDLDAIASVLGMDVLTMLAGMRADSGRGANSRLSSVSSVCSVIPLDQARVTPAHTVAREGAHAAAPVADLGRARSDARTRNVA